MKLFATSTTNMRGISRYISLFVFFLLGCVKDAPKTYEEYKNWFNESNGYVKSQQVDNLEYRIQYKPFQLMALPEFEADKSYTEKEVDEVFSAYGENSYYFLLEIGPNKEGSQHAVFSNMEEYNLAMDQLAFKMGSMCRLVIDEHEYLPVIHHLEKEYEITQKYRVIVGFQPEETTEEFTFIFNDEIFNGGKVKFHFTPKTPPKLPLKLKV